MDAGFHRAGAGDAVWIAGNAHDPALRLEHRAVADIAGLGMLWIDQGRRAHAARVVADSGALDLDHLGTQVAERLCAERPGEDAAQVEHAYSCERSFTAPCSGCVHNQTLDEPRRIS